MQDGVSERLQKVSDHGDGVRVSRGLKAAPMKRALRLFAGEGRGIRRKAEASIAFRAVERPNPFRAMTEMDEVRELAPQLDSCAARGLERVRVAASAPANEILENGESSGRRVWPID